MGQGRAPRDTPFSSFKYNTRNERMAYLYPPLGMYLYTRRTFGGFQKLNNLIKIQFSDKMDSIFVILVKYRIYIDFPIHFYCIASTRLVLRAIDSVSKYLLIIFFIHTFRQIKDGSL